MSNYLNVNRIPEDNTDKEMEEYNKQQGVKNDIEQNYMKIDLNKYVNKATLNEPTFNEETFKKAIKDCDVFVVNGAEMKKIGKYKEMKTEYSKSQIQGDGNNTVKETYVIFEDDSKSETKIIVMAYSAGDRGLIGKSPDPLYILKADFDKNSTKTVGGKLKRSRKNKNTNKKSKNTRRKSIRRRRH